MKKILIAFAAACLLIPASCTKDMPVQQQTKPKQERVTEDPEINQQVVMRYSTGRETFCSSAKFTLVTYPITNETVLNIASCYSVNLINIDAPGTYVFGTTMAGPGREMVTQFAGPEYFLPLSYQPGSITIESIQTDRIKGTINVRLYTTYDTYWEGVDTIFLNISGSFDGKLNRVTR